jgi:AcrR family transcriptional regulator
MPHGACPTLQIDIGNLVPTLARRLDTVKLRANAAAVPRNPTYFDGDLRTALLAAAEAEVEAHGAAQVSLRSIAKRAGVSHAAPAHHFGDKQGLFTAMATAGFTELSADMDATLSATGRRPAAERIQELGMVYIGFSQRRPAVFEVMWRPELHHRDAPALHAAADATRATMTALIEQARHEGWTTQPTTEHLVLLGWAAVHGLAVLWRGGPLAAQHAGQDPALLSRAVMRALADALIVPGQR